MTTTPTNPAAAVTVGTRWEISTIVDAGQGTVTAVETRTVRDAIVGSEWTPEGGSRITWSHKSATFATVARDNGTTFETEVTADMIGRQDSPQHGGWFEV